MKRFLFVSLCAAFMLVSAMIPFSAQGQAIESGQYVTGFVSTNAGQQIKRYAFDGAVNDSIIIRAATEDDLYQNVPDVHVFDPVGNPVFSQIDTYIRTDIVLTNIAASGWYWIECHLPAELAAISNSLNYSVSMLRLVDYPLSYADTDVGSIQNGKSLTGTINVGADLDAAFFSITNECTIVARLGQKAVGLVPNLQLYGPDGRLIAVQIPPEYKDEITARISDPGIYSIVMNDYFNATGPYAITMVRVPGEKSSQDPDIGNILSGETKSGTIHEPGDMDIATFSAMSNDIVQVTMSEYSESHSVLNPRVVLYNPAGILLAQGADPFQVSAVISNRCETNGVFYIICKDAHDRHDVRYKLNFEILSGPSVSNLPPAPAGLEASDGTYSNYVRVSWDPVAGADGYDLFRNYGTNESIQIVTNHATTVYLDYKVQTNVLYYYRVRARNYYGTGPFSLTDSGYAGAGLAGVSRRALVVGINKYDPAYGPTDLNACVNDANGIRSTMLLGDPGQRWKQEAIQLLTDNAAPKAMIRNFLNIMASASGAGDLVLYYQSSHGGQISGTDTFLCTYDSSYTDAELAADLALFNVETKVVVIVDACHSGGLFKSAGWPFAEQVMRHYLDIKRAEYAARGLAPPKALGNNIAFMTACDYNETCWEGALNRVYTGFLLSGCGISSVDTNANSQYEFYELHAYADQKALTVNPDQHAQHYNFALLNSEQARAVGSSFTDTIRPECDYDGDMMSDLAVYNPYTGEWYIYSFASGVLVWGAQWGGLQHVPLSGDYDGDGKADISVYDISQGYWYILSLDGRILAWAHQWGGHGMTPVSGDYDGDGRTDLAVYEPENGYWFVQSMTGAIVSWGVSLAGPGFVPLPGDYNKSHITDYALYHTNTAHWILIDGYGAMVQGSGSQFGASTMRPVYGDYDGGGTCDLAVYEAASGAWYIATTGGDILAWNELWGGPSMLPVPGDYDGDGKSDLAVYDMLTGCWYIKPVAGLSIMAWQFPWGSPGMIPVRPTWQ